MSSTSDDVSPALAVAKQVPASKTSGEVLVCESLAPFLVIVNDGKPVAQADVTIVVAATTCGESADRQNLSLDGGQLSFVQHRGGGIDCGQSLKVLKKQGRDLTQNQFPNLRGADDLIMAVSAAKPAAQ